MMVVYKYPICLKNNFQLILPRGAKPLSFQYQNNQGMMLWVLQDTDDDSVYPRQFGVFGTGQVLPYKKVTYIGTLQDMEGFVWHLFEFNDNDC